MSIQREDSSSNIADKIETELLKSLKASNEQSANESIVFTARDDSRALIGGITASTSYGWLLIKTLWVHENHRAGGIGKRLMKQAEDAGRELGCHGAWLDTSDAAAEQFYKKQGYSAFGELRNSDKQSPAAHRRWFMRKGL